MCVCVCVCVCVCARARAHVCVCATVCSSLRVRRGVELGPNLGRFTQVIEIDEKAGRLRR